MTTETLAINQPLPNKFDDLELFGLREDPEAWEALILNEIKRANNDPIAKQVLESTYWESDREIAFERFFRSRDSRRFIHSFKPEGWIQAVPW